METELWQPYQAIVLGIQRHCNELQAIEKHTPNISDSSSERAVIATFAIEGTKTMHIGGLCSLLETLNKSILSENEIDMVISGLQNITSYRHCKISSTIENLKKRKPPVPNAQ